jgi:hypothetical protein
MFEVISVIGQLKTVTECNGLTEALRHARFLQNLYYGPCPEILGSAPDAMILIKPVR